MLRNEFEQLLQAWRPAFRQQRTFLRARRLLYGLLLCATRHLTASAIRTLGRQFRDWCADYRFFSRAQWEPRQLFDPIIIATCALLPPNTRFVVVALDDTLCHKTGRSIPGVVVLRDPLSPAYHVNLVPGLRYVQLSLLLAPTAAPGPARGIPVRFEPAPLPKKPRKGAPANEQEAYRQAKKEACLTAVGLAAILSLRQSLDANPVSARMILVLVVDGSYTNGNILKNLPPRTIVIGRIRKDAKLHLPLPPTAGKPKTGRPRRYGPAADTPEEVLKNDKIPWQGLPVFAVGEMRTFQIKTIDALFWRKTGCDRPLRLVIIKPVGYRLRNGSKLLYRQPAFLICTDPELDLSSLVQAYVRRWEIECNHRDEKSIIGVGEGQVRNPKAVARLPQFQVAGYSLLLLASLRAYGFDRTEAYFPLPKWRQKSIRPSPLDIIDLLRAQLLASPFSMVEGQETFSHFDPLGFPPPLKSSKLPLLKPPCPPQAAA